MGKWARRWKPTLTSWSVMVRWHIDQVAEDLASVGIVVTAHAAGHELRLHHRTGGPERLIRRSRHFQRFSFTSFACRGGVVRDTQER